MTFRNHSKNRALARGLASACAALLLFAQLLTAAHFHEGVASRSGVAAVQLSEQTVDFALSVSSAFHSPGSVAAASTPARAPAPAESIVLPESTAIETPVFSPERGRAPPVSL